MAIFQEPHQARKWITQNAAYKHNGQSTSSSAQQEEKE